MNDGTNPKQQKASAIQSDHRAGWADRAFRLALLQKGWEELTMKKYVPSEL
jgi:hypothetical protein